MVNVDINASKCALRHLEVIHSRVAQLEQHLGNVKIKPSRWSEYLDLKTSLFSFKYSSAHVYFTIYRWSWGLEELVHLYILCIYHVHYCFDRVKRQCLKVTTAVDAAALWDVWSKLHSTRSVPQFWFFVLRLKMATVPITCPSVALFLCFCRLEVQIVINRVI